MLMTGEGASEPHERPAGEPPEQPRPRRRRRRRRKQAGGSQGATTQGAKRAQDPPTGQRKAATPTPKPKAGARRTGKGKGGKKKKKTTPTRPRIPTQKEVSAGGVVYRRSDGGVEVVLASRRTRRGDLAWGLAKGGVELGESFEDAAVREVREETGLDAEIEADLGDTKYFYVWEEVRIRKTVHFFLMRHLGGDTEDRDDEMEEIRWFPLERALKRAAYRGERDVLVRAAEILR